MAKETTPNNYSKIKVNKAQCLLCKDIIESKHRHDWVECKCGNLFVDGGKDYLRRGGLTDSYKELSR